MTTLALAPSSSGLPKGSWLANLFSRPDTPHALDDEFEGTALDNSWIEFAISGTLVARVAQHRVMLHSESNLAGPQIAGIVKPLGGLSFPLTIEAALQGLTPGVSFPEMGLGFVSLAGAIPVATDGIAYNRMWTGNPAGYAQNGGTLDNADVTGGGFIARGFAQLPASRVIARFEWRAANTWKSRYSIDGQDFIDFKVGTMTHALTPTHFGIFAQQQGAGNDIQVTADYIRVYESVLP